MSNQNIFTKDFWVNSASRAIKTFCQVLAALLATTAITDLSATWAEVLLTAGLAAVVSVLTSVYGGYTEIDTQTNTISRDKPANASVLEDEVYELESDEKGL